MIDGVSMIHLRLCNQITTFIETETKLKDVQEVYGDKVNKLNQLRDDAKNQLQEIKVENTNRKRKVGEWFILMDGDIERETL